MSITKVVLCGYYGKGNGGDEALLVTLLQMLPEDVQPIVLSGNPQETKKLYDVASCDRTSAFPILKALKQSDIFIWGGGSLMQDATSFASPIYYAGLMALAQQRGLTTIAWAQGIGPLKLPVTRWITRQTLLGCSAISVRDLASAELLTQWNLSPVVAPDPVWALRSSTVRGLSDFPAPRVAVVLRPHSCLTLPRLETLTQALVDFQAATNTFILLVPFQLSQDLEIAKHLANKLGDNCSIIPLQDPTELKGLFKEVEMTIAMRLHGLIMAASEGSRCYALSYDPKVTQLMSELNLPGWKLTELPEDSQIISQAWIEHYTNGLALNEMQIQSIVDRALLHQQLLIQTINNRPSSG
ncbi:MAG: polysaccharide pyruvyl transferase CsaB [Pleurocapsa sp.]